MEKTARQIQKKQTKDSLIKAAYEYFSTHGILSTRMSDIAQAAGVSHGTVFLHFKTQDALITEVIETYCGKIAQRTHELESSSASFHELLTAHLASIGEYEPFYTRLVIENRLLPAASRDAWINLQSAISFHFAQVVEKESDLKIIKEIPTYLLFNMWIGLIHYYLANGDLFAPDGKVLERYGETLVSTYIKMIQQKTGDEKDD